MRSQTFSVCLSVSIADPSHLFLSIWEDGVTLLVTATLDRPLGCCRKKPLWVLFKNQLYLAVLEYTINRQITVLLFFIFSLYTKTTVNSTKEACWVCTYVKRVGESVIQFLFILFIIFFTLFFPLFIFFTFLCISLRFKLESLNKAFLHM